MSETQRALIRERDELQRKAMIDGPARLWNRAAIPEVLGGEVARAKRSTPLCIAMIDADHFKTVNDNHGNKVGDAVLVELPVRMPRLAREFDAASRNGGEEIAAVLSNCSLDPAQVVAERLLSSVAEVPVATPVGPPAVTVSIGFAAYGPAHADVRHTIGAVDASLYRSRANGRNRVEI